jgi:two-component system, oxyanion-binding sensor
MSDVPAGRSSLLPITVGFVPLVDAALLVAAREEGFAEAEGLNLILAREGSWAAVRDKLNVGLFDAAHMLAPAAVASTLGLGHVQSALVSPVALNLDGNGVTVSLALASELQFALAGQKSIAPADTARALAATVRRRKAAGQKQLVVGVVFNFSAHLYQVRAWLRLGGIDPDQDVQTVVIPPPLMVESLAQGHIDLFCAGAPWNRMADIRQAGRVLHACSAVIPDCLEKLLVLRGADAEQTWVGPLVRAVTRAASWAADPANLPILARHLARPDYVAAPAAVIESILLGSAPMLFPAAAPAAWIRLDPAATEPNWGRLEQIQQLMAEAGQIAPQQRANLLLREDLHRVALSGK